MRHRLFLLRQLVHHDVRGRYAGSMGGFLWSFAHPLWQLALFWFAFGAVMRIPLGPDAPTESFAVFLFSGLLPWMAVQEGIQRGATAITDNAELVKKVRFPPLLLVVSVVVAALVHEGIAALVFAVVLVALGELSWPTLPWLLVALPLQVALVAGLASGLAVLQVFVRDMAQLLGMLLMAWFYLTPIVYPLSIVPERLQRILALNPLTALVELYRAALLGGQAPTLGLAILAATAGLALASGVAFFRRTREQFADLV
jgi:ABC-type polysaccharide/polyol phosphate export permease